MIWNGKTNQFIRILKYKDFPQFIQMQTWQSGWCMQGPRYNVICQFDKNIAKINLISYSTAKHLTIRTQAELWVHCIMAQFKVKLGWKDSVVHDVRSFQYHEFMTQAI